MNGLVHPHLERIDRAIDALRAERRRLCGAVPSVAYQGAPGAFSEDAARALAGDDARLQPLNTLDDVFEALALGVAEFAVIPVENSLAGPVPRAAELIRRFGCRVMAEHSLRIAHALIGCPESTIEGLRRAASHPVAALYNGVVLLSEIQDRRDNFTRFVVVAKG